MLTRKESTKVGSRSVLVACFGLSTTGNLPRAPNAATLLSPRQGMLSSSILAASSLLGRRVVANPQASLHIKMTPREVKAAAVFPRSSDVTAFQTVVAPRIPSHGPGLFCGRHYHGNNHGTKRQTRQSKACCCCSCRHSQAGFRVACIHTVSNVTSAAQNSAEVATLPGVITLAGPLCVCQSAVPEV